MIDTVFLYHPTRTAELLNNETETGFEIMEELKRIYQEDVQLQFFTMDCNKNEIMDVISSCFDMNHMVYYNAKKKQSFTNEHIDTEGI